MTLKATALFAGPVVSLLLCAAALLAIGVATNDARNASAGGATISIDMDISDGACTDIDATRPGQAAPFQVAVCLVSNPTGSAVAAYNFDVLYDDTVIAAPEVTDAGASLDDNPDANAGTTTFSTPNLGSGWDCTGGVGAGPRGDSNVATGAGNGDAFSGGCGSAAGPNTLLTGPLAVITFNVVNSAGTTVLDLNAVAVAADSLVEIGSCDPVVDTAATCNNGTFGAGTPSTPVPTNTPAAATATNTPGPGTATNTASPAPTETPSFRDADQDGVQDAWDACPLIVEDWDGFEDYDGCPDYDNDSDGIADIDDGCPMVAETFDAFKDGDGCPDPDNDNDGYPDGTDDCPGTDFTAGPDGIADSGDEPQVPLPTLTREDYDGVIDTDGCHDSPGDDYDGDGLTDQDEVFTVGTNPQRADTDDDGFGDAGDNCATISNPGQQNNDAEPLDNGPRLGGDDVTHPNGDATGNTCDDDDDNDGISDAGELTGDECMGIETQPFDRDTDGDHLLDGWECENGSNPMSASSRYLGSLQNVDTDSDRVPDTWERRGYHPVVNGHDFDGDGCGDLVEIASVDDNTTIDDGDRLAVARRAFGVWSAQVDQDYVFDISKNGNVGDEDRLFVARAMFFPDWQPKICP